MMPLSGKEMKRLFELQGYVLIKGQGKGSHYKLKRKSSPTITIPGHKELSTGMEKALLKSLALISKKDD